MRIWLDKPIYSHRRCANGGLRNHRLHQASDTDLGDASDVGLLLEQAPHPRHPRVILEPGVDHNQRFCTLVLSARSSGPPQGSSERDFYRLARRRPARAMADRAGCVPPLNRSLELEWTTIHQGTRGQIPQKQTLHTVSCAHPPDLQPTPIPEGAGGGC